MFSRNKSDEFAASTPSTASALSPTSPVSSTPSYGSSSPANGASKPVYDVARRVTEPTPLPSANSGDIKKLTVGRGISLDGRISSCDRLVVEGKVEAELQDCHTVEITATGTFRGAAEIERAEVSGDYEGALTARESLVIRGSGHVSGTIRYGRLQIEEGGRIDGDVKSLAAGTSRAKPSEKSEKSAPPFVKGNGLTVPS
jgi:cytoskeletal protein CcmA (bactofilin family)